MMPRYIFAATKSIHAKQGRFHFVAYFRGYARRIDFVMDFQSRDRDNVLRYIFASNEGNQAKRERFHFVAYFTSYGYRRHSALFYWERHRGSIP